MRDERLTDAIVIGLDLGAFTARAAAKQTGGPKGREQVVLP